jgi:hypothetical protein
MSAAAQSEGFDPSNFRRKLIRIRGRSPDAEQSFRESDNRILAIAQELSESAGAALIEKVDDGNLKSTELTRVYSAASNVVATKRRWSQPQFEGTGPTQDALANALEELRKGARIQITAPDPANQAIDVTPNDKASGATGGE